MTAVAAVAGVRVEPHVTATTIAALLSGGLLRGVFSLFQLLFDLRDLAVFQLGRLAEIAAAFRNNPSAAVRESQKAELKTFSVSGETRS